MGDSRKWAAEHCGGCYKFHEDCECEQVKAGCPRNPCKYPKCGDSCDGRAQWRVFKKFG